MKLEPGEKIATVLPVSDGDNVAVITEQGRGLLFPVTDIRPM
jgi:DNA gyrase/topoisomerase IV subunit A